MMDGYHIAEMHRSPVITDTEARRRLAACYSLLLELARKHGHSIPDDDPRPSTDVAGDGFEADYREPRYTSITLSTKTKPDDEERSVVQSDSLGTWNTM